MLGLGLQHNNGRTSDFFKTQSAYRYSKTRDFPGVPTAFDCQKYTNEQMRKEEQFQ